jgi:hypothetical protein
MLKNESAQNPTKPTPLRPSRLPDSGGIFTLSNGLRMRKLSHSDRKPKQVKSQRSTGQKVNVDDISMLTVQEMTWHSLADGDWAGLLTGQTSGRQLDQSMVDKWHLCVEWESATWPSHGQPRGTQSSVNVVCSKKKKKKGFGVPGF